MKKSILFLTITILICLCGAFTNSPTTVKAEENKNNIETKLILPSSYLEYFSLSSPIDVCYDGVNFVIAENKRISAYLNGLWQNFDLSSYSVSKIALYENYCLFLSSSELYYFSLNDGIIKKAGNVIISNYFYISGNVLITNPSTSIYRYTIKNENGELLFTEPTYYDGLSFSIDKFVVSSSGNLFYFLEQKIFEFNFADRSSTEVGKNLLANPRYTAVDGDIIYYSAENGIYSYNLSSKINSLIQTTSGNENLPAVVNPQGLYVYNGVLYFADSDTNSIFSISTETNNFTGFAVTTRSDIPNRINNASDISSYNNEIFILESNSIKVYNTQTNENYEYSLANFSGAKLMAVSKQYIFLTQGAQLYVLKYDGKTLKQVSLDNSVDIDEYKNISAVIAYENDFYFVDNQSRNSVMKACIYKLSTENMTITEIGNVSGAGQKLCVDIFGKIYIAINTNINFEYYSFIPDYFSETLSAEPLFSTAEKPLSMFVDIEDKLYILFDNEVLKCYEQSFIAPHDFCLNAEYTISLSPNLPSTTNIKLAELIPATNNLYFLADNLLFSTASELNISAPNRLKVPTNLKIELNENPQFIIVNKASKIFKVSIEDMSKEYFDFIEYATELSGKQFIVLNTTDRYSLIFNQDTCALVRNGDIQSISPDTSEKTDQYYMVNNFGLYSYPTTLNLFKLDTLNKNESVKLIKTIAFNGTNYCLIETGKKQGYVPETLLKPAIATDNTPTNCYTIKIAKGGANVYSDNELTNMIGTLSGETEVIAYESKNGVTKIEYNGGIGYIKNSSIQSSTYYSVRNIIVIACLFIAVIATLAYVFKTKVFDKTKS